MEAGDAEETQAAMLQAISALDKAAEKGVIHKNNAARRKGRLMKRMAALDIELKAAKVEKPKAEEKEVAKKDTPKKTASKKAAPKKSTTKKTAAKKTTKKTTKKSE